MATIEEICKKQGVWAYGKERSGAGRASEASQTMPQSEQVAQFPYAAKLFEVDEASALYAQDRVINSATIWDGEVKCADAAKPAQINQAADDTWAKAFTPREALAVIERGVSPNAGKAAKSDTTQADALALDVLTRLDQLEAQMHNPVSEAISGQTCKQPPTQEEIALMPISEA